ncbi:hypothetical protein Bbelb_122320 [Branchiostoma belcheri]|nr:hypothetical protein Bbelb_122320 [Branchiostoma belcheri]
MASIRILVAAGIVLLLCVDVSALIFGSSRRRRRRRCTWNWGAWGDCSAPCGNAGTQTRHASGCGAPGPESQDCNRFCDNGGTALSHSCSCPDEFWNTCCGSLEDVGGGASTNGTPGERAASLPAPRPARRRGAGRPGRRHAPASGSVTTAGLRVPPLDALVPTGSGTAAAENLPMLLLEHRKVYTDIAYMRKVADPVGSGMPGERAYGNAATQLAVEGRQRHEIGVRGNPPARLAGTQASRSGSHNAHFTGLVIMKILDVLSANKALEASAMVLTPHVAGLGAVTHGLLEVDAAADVVLPVMRLRHRSLGPATPAAPTARRHCRTPVSVRTSFMTPVVTNVSLSS